MSRDPLQSLPPELLLICISFLTPHDLSQLALTSSYNLITIRPILYRTVKLEIGYFALEFNISATFALLTRDKELAKCVVDLTLDRTRVNSFTSYPRVGPSLVHLGALANLVNLRHIQLKGDIFLSDQEQANFEFAMSSLHHLEELTYELRTDVEHLPGESFAIRGLKKITWEGYCDRPFSALWSLLSSSRETIETFFLLVAETGQDSGTRLWEMYFPKLRSLKLREVAFDYEDDDAPDRTDFVLAHGNTLEDLTLHMVDNDFGLDDDSTVLLSRDSLPFLRSFDGHLATFKVMAKAHMSCLTKTLHRLSISFDPGPQHLLEPLDLIISDRPRHPPVLKELDLSSTHHEEKLELTKEIIQKCGVCFGASLEVWTGGFLNVRGINYQELTGLFSPFVKLRVLHISPPDGAIDDGDYVHSLAFICPALQEVLVRRDGSRAELWDISRPSTPERAIHVRITRVDIPECNHYWILDSGNLYASN